MSANDLKLAIIAGEVSGDLLGADLVKALRPLVKGELSLIGVGGEGLEAEGLNSLFDYSELSIMGISQVLARLPKLILRIRQTARAIIAARPDILVIIDSPDFTHRVARIVRKSLPDLPVVNYVCPSVWAWKPERAVNMRPYVDHVLAVLPLSLKSCSASGGRRRPMSDIGWQVMPMCCRCERTKWRNASTQRPQHACFCRGLAAAKSAASCRRSVRLPRSCAAGIRICGSCFQRFPGRKVLYAR